jgi:conjugative transfer region protein (TIGR03750 family)
MKEASEQTADLIDLEPVLFLGCNNSEIQALALFGLFFGLLVGVIVVILTGVGLLVLPFLILGPMIIIYKGGKYLGKAKEGKPSGYYDRLIAVRFSALGISLPFLSSYSLVTRAGYWRNRR